MRAPLGLALLAGLGVGLSARPAASGRDLVAIRAGTILPVEGEAVHDGVLLVQGTQILAVGADVDVPVDARVVDYGPDAVVVPGLVAAYSPYGAGRPHDRTAMPDLSGVEGFDFFDPHVDALTAGVTSAYVTPADGRLIAGVGGVVKLAGEGAERRVLSRRATIHGAIDASARGTPGYWEPPIPATSDVGIGYPEPQLPRTTAGAVVALRELVAAARAGDTTTSYGPYVGTALAELVEGGVPWRIGARSTDEIRALLGFAREAGIPLVLDRADQADELAPEIAAAGVPVVFHVPFDPNGPVRDLGKAEDAVWPDFDVPAALVAAGAPVAIASDSPFELLFCAALASRGGLEPPAALRAITLAPAEMLGVADRVGSLAPGKDADFCVLAGGPFDPGTTVLETWIDGESRWSLAESGPPRAEGEGPLPAFASAAPTVLSVDTLYLGDGEVLSPGEVLLRDGRIAQVGPRVGRPGGARVVHGRAAAPGLIDALGHLGLEGSTKVPDAGYSLASIVAPGDRVDRRVAAAGITTVVLAPRQASREGAPMMAYKPAAADFERQVVGDPVALRLAWTERNRLESGNDVRKLLDKAEEYRREWLEYEKELAAWKPAAKEEQEAEATAEEGGDEGSASGDEEGQEDDGGKDKDKDKKERKKKKKDEEAPLEPDPITGVWQASLERPPRAEAAPFKMRVELEPHEGSGRVWGNLRSAALSGGLVDLEGHWDREARRLELSGLGDEGWIGLDAVLEEGKLVGKVTVAGRELELSAERTSKEFVVARRSPRPEKPEEPEEPEGKPRPPKKDEDLEPLRAAMEGRATVVVEVDREDEILACVDAFSAHGIRPVLLGASDAHLVADRIRGRVAGVLLSPRIVVKEPKLGTDYRTPYLELRAAGIPVAFHSAAEEGAAQLPLQAAYAVARGMSPAEALQAMTADTARMYAIGERVGRLAVGMDADVLLLDGPPLDPRTSVLRTWVNGVEVVREEEAQ